MVSNSVLSLIAQHLNAEGITWGLGGSLLLFQHGIIDHANDIDLLISESHATLSHSVLASLGNGERGRTNPPFRTRHFYEYEIEQTSIDVMGGFCIEHEQGVFEFPFDSSSQSGILRMDEASVPLSSLEDWFVLYQLMPSKKEKADQIESYFLQYGIQRPDLLTRNLSCPLPDQVTERIQALLQLSM